MSSTGTDLTWLPSDTEEQLSLGFRIITNAYKTRVNAQDAEIRSLKTQNVEKTEQIASLQKKLSTLEVQLIETTQGRNQISEENKQLVATIRKLQKDNHRLESLKKAVLTSIQEDHADDDAHKFYASEEILQNAAPRTMQELHNNDEMNNTFLSRYHGSGSGEAMFFETPGNPASHMPAHMSDGRVVDGKAFFRNARSRLSYENFNAFLANIKKLNNHHQTREDTLLNAQQLFGDSNTDLFEDFKLLLVRHS